MWKPAILSYLETVPERATKHLFYSLSSPLNISLLMLIFFLLLSIFPATPTIPLLSQLPFKPIAYNWRPAKHPSGESIVWRRWTPKELQPFDGTNAELQDGKILFAIRRKVYDVSGAGGKNFYGPGGAYSIFAGRDASRGLAKQSFDQDMLTSVDAPIDPLDDLTRSEWSNLKDWESHFQNKYVLCGDYVEP